MEYRIEFGGAPQDVTITTAGPADGTGLIGFVKELVADPRYRAGMSILVDHRARDARPLIPEDIRALATTVVTLSDQIGASRVAIVVPDPLTFAFARMYEAFAERALVRSRTFYNHSDALTWLESGGEKH